MRYSDGVIVFQLPTAVGNWWGNAIILHFGQQISFFFLWMINFCLLQQTEALCDRSLQGLNEILEDWVRSLRVSRLKEKSILFARVRQKKKKKKMSDSRQIYLHYTRSSCRNKRRVLPDICQGAAAVIERAFSRKILTITSTSPSNTPFFFFVLTFARRNIIPVLFPPLRLPEA